MKGRQVLAVVGEEGGKVDVLIEEDDASVRSRRWIKERSEKRDRGAETGWVNLSVRMTDEKEMEGAWWKERGG